MNDQKPTIVLVHRPFTDSASVGQIMKPTQSIEPGAHLAAATYLIRHSHDPALVVMRCDTPIPLGTLSYAEIAGAIGQGKDPENCLVKDVTTASRTTTTTETAVSAAARLMLKQGIQRLPVLDAQQLAWSPTSAQADPDVTDHAADERVA